MSSVVLSIKFGVDVDVLKLVIFSITGFLTFGHVA